MRLTKKDKEILGVKEEDLLQIERAISKTKFTLLEKGKETKISREEVLKMMGREDFLFGMLRSAFHCTTSRETKDGKTIHFDSYALFK